MKTESFFIGPKDDDISVQLNLSLKEIKFIHGMLVDCYNVQSIGKASSELEDAILYLREIITHTLLEKDKNPS